MSKTTLSSLEDNLQTTIEKYNEIPFENDMSKTQAAQILMREVKIVTDEQKRLNDQKIQEERFQLEKDHKYWSEKLEDSKFEHEKYYKEQELELAKKRFNSEKRKNNILMDIELSRIEIEKTKLEIEKTNVEIARENKKQDQLFRWLTLGVTISTSILVPLIGLSVQKKCFDKTLKLTYVDEGRPTKLMENASKSVNDWIKRH